MALIEEKAPPKHPEVYECPQEPGKYLSTVRKAGSEPSRSNEVKKLLEGLPFGRN